MTGAAGRGIIIAGTHSGCGKTTVTLGILAALRKKRLAVQPFKAGPDFIDSGLHRLVSDRPSRNLDLWMCGPEYVTESFRRHAADADISVVEGVMGMYDGESSAARLASRLQVPVLLVVDAYGMAESAGAVVHGFAEFGVRSGRFRAHGETLPGVAGVIFNRVASENHYNRLKASVRDVPVLGYLPREVNFEIPHRHLGLCIAEESPIASEALERLADTIIRCVDIDAIIQSAGLSTPGKNDGNVQSPRQRAADGKATGRFKVALAYDKAFSFYYHDNLDILRDAGADIIRFSPLADRAVPSDADAVYIGGGYPELNAEALSRNDSMLSSLHAWACAGKPLYAECGGLMYLSKGIRDFDGKFFAMAGVFPFETKMTKKPRLGYREILLNEDCVIGHKGEKCRGHEFHYSEIDEAGNQESPQAGQASVGSRELKYGFSDIYSVKNAAGLDVPVGGFRFKNTLASYVHVHFGSNPHIAERFAAFIKEEVTR